MFPLYIEALAQYNLPIASLHVPCQVIRTSLLDADVASADWTALEMHGTGTALGDPIEIGAAFAVAGSSGSDGMPTHIATRMLCILCMDP
jgi:acyl transferase domain-containing protein